MSSPESTSRFSDRVDNYVRYRPTYPAAVLTLLQDRTALQPASAIADIGSGTGISAQLFLQNGNTVFGIEPNAAMREAAETQLRQPNFHSITGTAETTTLPAQSVDYIVAAQAFHWFDQAKARQEFVRILRPHGWIVLMWNSRRTESTDFLKAYEALLQAYGTDYQEIRHSNNREEDLRSFFSGSVEVESLYNEQLFDFEGLKGRLLSSSYAPNPEHPQHKPMIQALKAVFEQYEEQGQVRFEYDTKVYFGRLGLYSAGLE